ncbi:hypothetical protein SAMN05421823_102526 [Catalinimonas alkaloidigena]|uniref:Uncharacterized protein n=1 Tax=Catalinimonas alkaloidigena TaxID=1075417 RepID=A0A1G9B7H2_9BACT|nr:hypothetical protein [Catalinimonas alkaloidigena]SDK35044.1 hypothetical protein SAMN05421823_102526 [Catalinimonas alkaloidigena]
MSTVLINRDATVAYLPSHEAAVTMEQHKATTTAPVAINHPTDQTLAHWGDDNLFPQTVLTECSKNTIVPSTLDKKARLLYAGGLCYGKTVIRDGKETFELMKVPAIETFLRYTNIRRYLIEACTDFYWFYNIFPELILSKDRTQILGLYIQEASFCRWALQNPRTGLVDWCYISANWADGADATSQETQKVRVLDPYFDPVYNLRQGNDWKYIYPVSYPTPGKTYYQLAHWDSLRGSGWLEFAQAIPEFKRALMKNQITVKYHINVPMYWWEWKYPDWSKKKPEEKQALMDEELKRFNDFLQGAKNAGKAIMTSSKFDPHFNKEFPGWSITPLEDKLKDGAYVEDSQEASSHLLYALGVPAALIGNTPGKGGMGAGSGSDVREHLNMYLTDCQIHQDIILEPLHFIRDYNGWDPEIEFRFRRPHLQTLDHITPSQRQTTPKDHA